MRNHDKVRIEPEVEAEETWVNHVNEVGDLSLRATCQSWYFGSNIPGKARVVLPYSGGFPVYVRKCDEVAANGYTGFTLN
jgi:cyclohexanone monooxygenase